jgi:hypothetical protein
MASLLAVVCFGSTQRLLGVAAATCGEHVGPSSIWRRQ